MIVLALLSSLLFACSGLGAAVATLIEKERFRPSPRARRARPATLAAAR